MPLALAEAGESIKTVTVRRGDRVAIDRGKATNGRDCKTPG